jgi:hypothetical protein
MATIPNPQITPIPNNEPDATPNLWNTRYVEIDANFSNLDDRAKAVELELSNSKGTYASLPTAISTIDDRVAQVEASISGADTFSIARIKQATHLDWAYRNDRISFEFFTPDYTLIDKVPTAVTGGILGDDSLDVASTDGVIAGNYYVLSDGTDTAMIRVKNVLSTQRLRLYDSLDKHWTSATVSQHNFVIDATTSFATAPAGSMWMSKLINIGNKNGKLVIRRSDNTAIVKAFYQAEGDSVWTETTPNNRITQVIDGVPAGFVDVEYQVPISENIRLRLEVSGEAVVIHHIVAFGLQYLESLNQAIADLAVNQVHLEQKANVHHLASTLDWAYRFDRMNFEFFAPEYTLINKSAISIREAAVQGDNTIDVGDTSQFVAGDCYVLYDGTHTRLIKVAAIHTDNILTIEGVLDRRWDKATAMVSKCNFDILGGNNAAAADGEMWISKPITLSTDALDGFAVIRRSYSAAQIKLWWMDSNAVWTESASSLRQVGNNDNKDGVPVGFADYEYALPFTGEGKIRIEVVGAAEPVTIQHIVAIGLFNAIGAANDAIDSLGVRQTATETATTSLAARQSFSELNAESLGSRITVSEGDIDALDSRQTATEVIVDKHHYASKLDWIYRFDRMNYEFFTPDYTLIYKPVVSIREVAVLGDDTLDVGDTTTFEVGDWYVLSDSTHNIITGQVNTALIQIKEIHTDNILRIQGAFTRRWDVNSKVSKCNLKVLGANNAIGNDGEMWISRPIAISTDALDGFAMIRRTHNDAQIKLWWMDSTHTAWQESIAELRTIGSVYDIDGVPIGFADYKYPVPMSGVGKIMIEVLDPPVSVNGTLVYNTRPIEIQHITTVGLFVNDGTLVVQSAPISTQAQAALDLKANLTTTYTKVEVDGKIQTVMGGVSPAALDTIKELSAQMLADESGVASLVATVSGKVDKVTGKALSTNDFTTTEKIKLAAIEAGAQVNPTFRTINGNPITGIGGDIVITGGTGGAASASALSFAPIGNIAATNVQAAIAELDAEKATTVSVEDLTVTVSSKANSADVYLKTEIDELVIGNLSIATINGGTF